MQVACFLDAGLDLTDPRKGIHRRPMVGLNLDHRLDRGGGRSGWRLGDPEHLRPRRRPVGDIVGPPSDSARVIDSSDSRSLPAPKAA